MVNIIHKLNTSTAKDIDGFQIKPIKYNSDLLAPILTHIFNQCLSQAVFPRKMQVARVTALHKKGSKNDIANYRPVSILPVMSKALEKVILHRFTDFEEKQSLDFITVWLPQRSKYGVRIAQTERDNFGSA